MYLQVENTAKIGFENGSLTFVLDYSYLNFYINQKNYKEIISTLKFLDLGCEE